MQARIHLAAIAALLLPVTLAAGQKELHLPIGDPARSQRQVPVVLDGIVDTHTGAVLTPRELPARLAGVRLLLVGESHTDMEFHRAQLRVIEELAGAGREVLVGLEMYPSTKQGSLDEWGRKLLTEEGFVELSHWYDSWGYPWGYYRELFLLCRERGIPMYALNVPREIVKKVREKGFDSLSEEERERMPPRVDTSSEEHRELFRSFFDPDDPLHGSLSEEQWEGMYRAQATWDAAMAWNALSALRHDGRPGAILVVLAGSGHVAYGLGIERQALALAGGELDGHTASLLPQPVRQDGEAVERVQASYADFVWGVAAEANPLFPSLGLSTVAAEGEAGRRVIYITEGSVADRAGFAVGDILVAIDGRPLPDRESLNRALAEERWGDAATFTVRRGETTLEIRALFRREP